MKLTRSFSGWYSLINSLCMDFQIAFLRSEKRNPLIVFIQSLLFMGHLTMLFSYIATPLVWALNPKQFVFTELLLTAGFFSSVTGVILSLNPVSVQNETFPSMSKHKFWVALRLFLALLIPLLSLLLLDWLVISAENAFI